MRHEILPSIRLLLRRDLTLGQEEGSCFLSIAGRYDTLSKARDRVIEIDRLELRNIGMEVLEGDRSAFKKDGGVAQCRWSWIVGD